MKFCKRRQEKPPLQNYCPSTDMSHSTYQEALFNQHWEEARSFNKQKMWITGLYFAGFSYVLSNPLPLENRIVFFLLFLAGAAAFLSVFKLQFLSEFHMSKAQIYVAGHQRGVIFDFHIKEPLRPGEKATPDHNCWAMEKLIGCFNMTALFNWIIFNSAVFCFYKSLPFLGIYFINNISHSCKVIVWGAILLFSYCPIRRLMNSAQKYARDKAHYNLSRGWHMVSEPQRRNEAKKED